VGSNFGTLHRRHDHGCFWDMLAAVRARALGVGLLSGGYSEDEFLPAGAMRVYNDPSDLLAHLDEVGVQAP
jgi:phosphoglycolate phosphatase-like HAD superfamily hydrolase